MRYFSPRLTFRFVDLGSEFMLEGIARGYQRTDRSRKRRFLPRVHKDSVSKCCSASFAPLSSDNTMKTDCINGTTYLYQKGTESDF